MHVHTVIFVCIDCWTKPGCLSCWQTDITCCFAFGFCVYLGWSIHLATEQTAPTKDIWSGCLTGNIFQQGYYINSSHHIYIWIIWTLQKKPYVFLAHGYGSYRNSTLNNVINKRFLYRNMTQSTLRSVSVARHVWVVALTWCKCWGYIVSWSTWRPSGAYCQMWLSTEWLALSLPRCRGPLRQIHSTWFQRLGGSWFDSVGEVCSLLAQGHERAHYS